MGIEIVVIGGSTNMIDPLACILWQLPARFGLPIVIAQHLSIYGAEKMLPAFGVVNFPQAFLWDVIKMGRRAAILAEGGETLTPGLVYIAPDRLDLVIEGGKTRLVKPLQRGRYVPCINRLFQSVAQDYGPRAMGILLSGQGDDGVTGLSALADAGAITIAQDPATCEAPSMPRAAIAAAAVKHILTPDRIAKMMIEFAEGGGANMSAVKTAAVYVRVSSERQAEKCSPQSQEAECRAYCEERGYQVVEVYRDISQYRVGRRLVEPSGTRADRPGLRAMLADAATGAFNVIVAWKEDRLYRGLRPMLDVIDCIEAHDLDVQLVKETFDRKMAPVKAWVARMELDNKNDRVEMGIAGRLAEGKAWNAIAPYGFQKTGEVYEVCPDEAEWVKQISAWFADGVGVREIRRRLIGADAPQKTQGEKPSTKWNPAIIYRILRQPAYHTGTLTIRWNGDTYDLPVTPLVDADTAQAIADRLQKSKRHPARHLKNDYLAMGLLYCQPCDCKMSAQTRTKKSVGGERVTLKTPTGEYRCNRFGTGTVDHDSTCPHRIGSKKLDTMLWEKVWTALADDEKFEAAIQDRIQELQAEETDGGAKMERLQQALEDLELERQKIITWGRKKIISQDDMETQLAAMTFEEATVRRDLYQASLLVGNRAQKLIDFIDGYRRELAAGSEWLNAAPDSPEMARRQFERRREIVDAVVARVDLLPDKTIKVHFDFGTPPETEENLVNATSPNISPGPQTITEVSWPSSL